MILTLTQPQAGGQTGTNLLLHHCKPGWCVVSEESFKCRMLQMKRIKNGDRYFFSLQNSVSGFSPVQMEQIRKVSQLFALFAIIFIHEQNRKNFVTSHSQNKN